MLQIIFCSVVIHHFGGMREGVAIPDTTRIKASPALDF